jgi:hypothetical protein
MLEMAAGRVCAINRCDLTDLNPKCGLKLLVYEALSYWCMRP